MAVTIQQAALNALQTWLTSELPDVTVRSEWPIEPQLPDQCISILPAGPPIDEQITMRHVSMTPVDPQTGTYTYQIKARRQPVQLDIFARYEAVRCDIEAQLDVALHKGEYYTLSPNRPYGSKFRDGPLLALGDDWTGYVDFTFDPPEPNDTADAAARSEWRSTMRGEAGMVLTITAESPRIALAGIRMLLGEGPLAEPGPIYQKDFDADS